LKQKDEVLLQRDCRAAAADARQVIEEVPEAA
jgi:hypothetical protein